MKPNIGKRSVHVPRDATPIAMVDAHVAINGCQVFLGHPDPARAKASAQGFKQMLGKTIARSKVPNMGDFYNAHVQMCERLKKGETIKEIIQ